MAVIKKDKPITKKEKRKYDTKRHSELVDIAEKWLYSVGCSFVLKELTTMAEETPDDIGFREGISILVECKTSKTDFKKDAKKIFRRGPKKGMGDHRFYLCPEGVIKPDEIPEGFGLIYVNEKGKTKVIAGNTKNTQWYKRPFIANKDNERLMLLSSLRRVKRNGDLSKIFEPKKLYGVYLSVL